MVFLASIRVRCNSYIKPDRTEHSRVVWCFSGKTNAYMRPLSSLYTMSLFSIICLQYSRSVRKPRAYRFKTTKKKSGRYCLFVSLKKWTEEAKIDYLFCKKFHDTIFLTSRSVTIVLWSYFSSFMSVIFFSKNITALHAADWIARIVLKKNKICSRINFCINCI